MRTRTHALVFAALGLALALELAAILALNEGRFVYTLDDPYIHFALAAQLRHGHYGINPGEGAAPSSSPLWPFLLAPCGDLAALEYVPLAMNALLALATAGIFASLARRALGAERDLDPAALLATLALIGVTNTTGLVYTGMEHSLQLWLAVASVWGTWRALREERAPAWLWCALSIGPWVRYESAGLSLVLWIVLARHGLRRSVMLSAAASALSLLAFSGFLHEFELPLLPTSVLAKAGAPTGGRPFAVLDSVAFNLTRVHGWILLGWSALLAAAARGAASRAERELCSAVVGAIALHLVAGRLGWFSRYEMYLIAARRAPGRRCRAGCAACAA